MNVVEVAKLEFKDQEMIKERYNHGLCGNEHMVYIFGGYSSCYYGDLWSINGLTMFFIKYNEY